MKQKFYISAILTLLVLFGIAKSVSAVDIISDANVKTPFYFQDNICIGNIDYDMNAATACATQTEAAAKAKGYNSTCTVEKIGFPFVDTQGHSYYLRTTCSNIPTPENTPGSSVSSTPLQTSLQAAQSVGQNSSSNNGQTVSISVLQQKVKDLTKNLYDLLNARANSAYIIPIITKTDTDTSTSGCSSLTSNLSKGSTGSQVTILTNFLVKEGLLQSAQSTFDDAVFNAVVAYQERNADAVLVPINFSKGTGYVGEKTRAVINPLLCPSTVSTGTSDGKGVRYVKIEVNKKTDWIAFWEIEVYDTNGNKVTTPNTKVTASSDWNFPGKKDQYVGTAQSVVDGNENVAWNAGETYSACNWTNPMPDKCYTGRPQTAWIELDLGKSVDVGKVRLLNVGDTIEQTTNIYVKPDGGSYSKFATLEGPEFDRQWLQYPSPYSGDPTVTLTVNGATSTNVNSSETLKYDWSTSNADYVTMEYKNDGNPYLSTSDGKYYCNLPGLVNGSAMVPFFADGGTTWAGSNGIFMNKLNGSEYKQAYNTGCYEGHNTVTLVAHQRGNGKTARATVDINYVLQQKDSKSFRINVNNSQDKITISRGETIDRIQSYVYFYPNPQIDLGPNTKIVSVPAGMTVTKDSATSVYEGVIKRTDTQYWYFTQHLHITAASSMTPGQYVLTLGAYDEHDPSQVYYYDIIVTVK